ncbi:hypothetical protein KAR52_01580 [Candidatus Pacearchaeota archaeon]|nr:hypothetical protein [Candidatus Pacearchaeota archaeon]
MGRIDSEKKLVEYFKKNLVKGYTLDALKFALINQGYSRTIVERAIQQTNKELSEKAPILKEKPKITYEIIDENNKPISVKKSFWKRILGL